MAIHAYKVIYHKNQNHLPMDLVYLAIDLGKLLDPAMDLIPLLFCNA